MLFAMTVMMIAKWALMACQGIRCRWGSFSIRVCNFKIDFSRLHFDTIRRRSQGGMISAGITAGSGSPSDDWGDVQPGEQKLCYLLLGYDETNMEPSERKQRHVISNIDFPVLSNILRLFPQQ